MLKLALVIVPALRETRWGYATGRAPYIRWMVTTIEHNRPVRYDH
jgi:hypothetical protein